MSRRRASATSSASAHERRTWDLEEAVACGVTDDVAKLMTERVDRLPEATRELLQIGACVGAVFDLDTVATVLGHDMARAARHLEPAFAARLILPLDASYNCAAEEAEVARLRGVRGRNNPRYRFLHDRVEQAAHEGLPEARRAEVHLALGRMLLALGVDVLADRVIDVASHLGEALTLLVEPKERQRAAEVFLAAARRAKACMATGAAARYLRDCLSLLAEGAWDTARDMALALHTTSAGGRPAS